MTEISYLLFYMLSLQTPVFTDSEGTPQFGPAPF